MKINAPRIWRGAPLLVKEFRLLFKLRALSYLTLDLCNTYSTMHEVVQETKVRIALPSRGRGRGIQRNAAFSLLSVTGPHLGKCLQVSLRGTIVLQLVSIFIK